MKILLTIFLLFFSSSVFSEDISDFQIEGISIGDSLLNYFTENEIKEKILRNTFPGKDNKFLTVEIYSDFYEIYDLIQFHILDKDTNYKIYSIQAMIFQDIKSCKKNFKEISIDLSKIFPNLKKESFHNNKLNDDGLYSGYYFEFANGDVAGTYCYDWYAKTGWSDNLRVSLYSAEFDNWLSN